MELSLDTPMEDLFPSLPSSNIHDSNADTRLDSIPILEYLGEEPLTMDEVHFFPCMSIYPDQQYTFGREGCTYNIPDPKMRISKRHFRIYTVVYGGEPDENEGPDENEKSEIPDLVYCEDFQSLNGTYVNGVLIGKMERDKIAYLLTDGDEIEIKPGWKFRFHQPNSHLVALKDGNNKDIEYFKDSFVISDRVLGEGQFGTVYLAQEVESSTQVACKILDLKTAAKKRTAENYLDSNGKRRVKRVLTSTIKQEFRKEIEMLAKLSHPNIINLRKAFCSDSTMYIFTDLAPGGDLFSYITRQPGGYLEDLQARIIAWQLMQAVSYMHNLGIVHRDIKPENVLIAQTDFGGRVILTDFGFATYASKGSSRLMSKVGTPGYAAPEIEAFFGRGYRKDVDLWASGMVVAYMLTSRKELLKGLNPDSPMIEQQEVIDDFCDRMTREAHIKPNSVDFVRKLVVANPNRRLPASFALNHKWFTNSKREAVEQMEVYRRATKYWRSRETEIGVIEDISSANFTPPTREDSSVLGKRKKLRDMTMSPYFTLDRHLQVPRVAPTRKQTLRDLGGNAFIVVPEAQGTKWNNRTNGTPQPQLVGAMKVVDGRNIFEESKSAQFRESQIETQDLTRDDADEVDLVPTTPSSALSTYTNPKEFLGRRTHTINSSRIPLKDNTPSKRSHAQTGSENKIKTDLKQLAKSQSTKALTEMEENVAGRRKGSKRGVY